MHLARLEADAHERGMDPDLSSEGVLRAVSAALARPTSGMTGAELAANRAMLRGAMRGWLERTGAEAAGVAADGAEDEA